MPEAEDPVQWLVAEAGRHLVPTEEIVRRIGELEEKELVMAIPLLTSTGATGEKLKGIRDGALAALDAKLSGKLAVAISGFDRSSTILARAMIVLAAAQLVVAIIGLLK